MSGTASNWLRDQLQASLGRSYTIERELGGGGMSRVFVAEEHELNRKVVVKVLPDDVAGAVSIQRFKREIALAARLHHPHIVPVLTAGETSGTPFYTMPLVVGETLRERLAREPMGSAETIRLLREMASALAYAHENRIVHRDVKPENVLLAGGSAAITDFGVAKALTEAKRGEGEGPKGLSTTLTSFGVALGTPAYMSPEQAAADPNVDHRADIYSLGCVAYEMLSGTPPFAGRTPQQTLAAHVMTEPPSIDATRPDIPSPLASLVMRCLAKSPGERPQSATDIVSSLDEMTTTSGAHRSAPFASRSRAIWLGAFAATAIVGAGLVLLFSRATEQHETTSSRSVGVLPFANLSDDKANEYFSEGITQEITSALGKITGLRIASQSPASAEPKASRDPRTMGRALGVETLLIGGVQRAGDRVRITARLIKVADGFQIWSDKYDRELKDVFAVQDEIARAIVSGLRLTLASGPPTPLVRAGTRSSEAHTLYLQGMYYWNRRTLATLRKSIEVFHEAIAKDSSYAAPWAGLALAYAVIVDYGDFNVSAMSDSALFAGRRALALDSTSADAYTAIAEAHSNRWENAAALAAFRRAVTVDSNNARACQWYAEALAHVGQFDEAIRQIYRARELEPLTLIINANVGRVELEARRYAQAESALRHTIELDSTQQTAHSLLSFLLLYQGRTDEAVKEAEFGLRLTGTRPTMTVSALGYVYATAGRRADAEAILRELEDRAKRERVSYGGLALLSYALGKQERAIEALDSAVAQFDAMLKMRSREQAFDALRRHPRAAPLLAKAETAQ
jgi:serine/threonine-protein kinase